ncbi:MAG: ACT domain-containing protein [Terriglobales bacterium]
MLVRFDIEVDGQTLAFERVLCAVRRRAFEIRWLQLQNRGNDDAAQIAFAIETDEREAERLEANLWKLHEIRAVRRTKEGRVTRLSVPLPGHLDHCLHQSVDC